MKIDIHGVIRSDFDYKFGRIRHLQSELSTAYKDERIDMIKEIEQLQSDLKDEISNLRYLVEELEGEMSNLF